MSSLPQGVWTVIADILAAEGNGEQWMMSKKNKWQVHREWRPLRALTQVSQTTRAAAMPAMWRHIKLLAKNENFPNLLCLAQLTRELSLGSVNCKSDITFTSKLPLGARAYVESIELDFRLEQIGSVEKETDRPLVAGDVLEVEYYYLCKANGPWATSTSVGQAIFGSSDGELGDALESFAHKLQGCPQLKHFEYRSSYVGSELFLSQLLKCSKLESLSLDLRGNIFDDLADNWLYPQRCQCAARLQFPLRPGKLKRISLGLTSYDMLATGPDDSQRGDLLLSDFQAVGVDLTDWLLGLPLLRSLCLAAPVLFYQPWMLPIWAQLDELQEWSIAGDEPGSQRQAVDEPLWLAARRFPRLLQDEVWPAFKQRRHLFPHPAPSTVAACSEPPVIRQPDATSSATATSSSGNSTIEGIVTMTLTGPVFSVTNIVNAGGSVQPPTTRPGGQTLLFPKNPTRKKEPKIPDVLEKLAHDIFDLIHSHKDLSPWRKWFPDFDKPSRKALDIVHTKTILVKVAEVLADKCANTTDKRGLKRKRWDEQTRHKCPCACDFCDAYSEESWGPSDMTDW